ncbi:MAG: hypothetical protein WD009_01935 [Phycisphaeraceae bacterium]
MSKGKPKRPRDLNQAAKRIVDEATGEAEPGRPEDEGKDPAAVERGKMGAKARLSRLTPEERSTSARNAALARWNKS